MKKITTLLLCIILVMSMHFPANASEQGKLSNMTEEECIEFLKEAGVSIPTDYEDEMMWGSFVKKVISLVESNPYVQFYYNYTVTQEFAYAIKEVVNRYYNTSNSAALYKKDLVNPRSLYALVDNVAVGPWLDIYRQFNCYVYAINHDAYVSLNPGFFSRKLFSISLPVGKMAEYVSSDLIELGYERVFSSLEMELDNLCINEKIICIRKGSEDYHLMRFTNGNWYHKPGETQILRYLHEINPLMVWSSEHVIENVAYPGNHTYDSEIYFISYDGHSWSSYTNNQTGTHTRRCSICMDIETTPCKTTYISSGNDGHYEYCRTCGFTSITIAHNMEYSYTSSGRHKVACRQCDYTITENCTNNAYEYYGQVDGVHKHQTVCSKCDHATGTVANCLFKGTSTVCSHCKHDKGISSGTVMKKPGDGTVQTYQE